MAKPSSTAHLDTLAQQMGFRDYATYSAYKQHQNEILGAGVQRQRPIVQQGASQQPIVQPGAGQPPANWFQRLLWGLNGGRP